MLKQKIQVVVIAISTGGPATLRKMLPCLAQRLPVPIIIVQHMPAVFTRVLAEQLDRACGHRVLEAEQGAPLDPGHVYIAPGDYHLTLSGTPQNPTAQLDRQPQENGCRPAADVLFRSAARMYRSGCLGVVMSGMGRDGLQGTREIVMAGGYALAQDQDSSVIWSMPKAIIDAGLANEIHSLEHMGDRVNQLVAPTRSPFELKFLPSRPTTSSRRNLPTLLNWRHLPCQIMHSNFASTRL